MLRRHMMLLRHDADYRRLFMIFFMLSMLDIDGALAADVSCC